MGDGGFAHCVFCPKEGPLVSNEGPSKNPIRGMNLTAQQGGDYNEN